MTLRIAEIALIVVLSVISIMTTAANGNPLNSPPGTPVLVSPTNNGRFYSENITFTWRSVLDPDAGDQVSYNLRVLRWLSPADTLPLELKDLTDTTITLSFPFVQLHTDYRYRWSLWAKDQWGNTSSSLVQWYWTNFPYGNADGIPPIAVPDISDAVFLIVYIFGAGPAPDPL